MPPAEGRIGGVDDLGGPQEWFNSLPVVTKFWFGSTFALTLAVNFGVFSLYNVAWVWESFKSNFEIWRVVSSFCYMGKFDMSTLFGLYMLVNFSKQYEAGGPYNTGGGGGTADFVFCFALGCLGCLITYPFLAGVIAPLFAKNMTFYILYIWSKQNPNKPANIWGFPLKAQFLPFAYLAITVLMGGPYWDIVHGIGLGHLYYFTVDVVPLMYAKDVIHTPQFLIDYFGVGQYVPPVAANPRQQGFGNNTFNAPGRVNPPSDPVERSGSTGYNWGRGGQTLGNS
eukprot:CAMPEP_0171308604 /NCGR_PEP_ID=MMETSP0816-20121228/18701_1 /TAXON_ID=420281 /ORGANISM="Proboscia inermis, Strain CCAP1064/1" /LENGTH=282 /DNA_ID=CAMNT_0011791579 /DNA_START=30 /DNA_END=878 /DNA_ORIENTATION=-